MQNQNSVVIFPIYPPTESTYQKSVNIPHCHCHAWTLSPSLFTISSITVLSSKSSSTLKINTISKEIQIKLKWQFSFSICKLCLHFPSLQSYPAEPSLEFNPPVQFSRVDSASYLFTKMGAVFVSSFDSIISLIYSDKNL